MVKSYEYEVFTAVIEEQIRCGILKSKDRLPSVRAIKEKYQLSMSSVQSGFEYLMIKGLIESSPRSGYFVADKSDEAIPEMKTKLPVVVRDEVFMKNMMLTSKRVSESSSFNTAVPGDLLIPQKLILRTMQEVIREKGASLLRYYPPNGLEELRIQIAKRMRGFDCKLNPDEIIITDGALQALTIALSAVTKAGDTVAVDSPCVFSVLEVIANLGLKVIEIPVHYRSGFDIEYFQNIAAESNIRALIVTPSFHNPTGITMTDEVKKKIVEVAEFQQLYVIENDIYSDLYFEEKRPSCIKSFDQKGWVMIYSSFSKTLAPGIRLGWLHAGSSYSKAERTKFVLGRSVSPIYQELILKLLKGNSYERHLRQFRKNLSQQAAQLLDVLRKSFPEGSYFHRPQGGYSIWAQMPENMDMKKFYQYCEDNRILFTPGDTFSFTDKYDHHFRVVFAERITSESILLLEKTGGKVNDFLL
ncbi:DNA-binding transcriptional regulator, MocR family, contains an aminotransferase domain [Chryseobacterium ureilyticum]|uniref:DNA-binding transcriptional regulator, MocR family, contains an aminotransferase domain n=1 Tax=Chryseobacterium ureilyticum TaxID=373668 RepID=A0A1N7KTD2_9FLAO|nr:PLP-dependent aminotransferase family protein [Chryseobacterium ureilyticum]SIS64815.1 DNA-binding transcriptional regulator, MocR family, contains an aminotransferase domain [Chryseobacterium ureilyticum]